MSILTALSTQLILGVHIKLHQLQRKQSKKILDSAEIAKAYSALKVAEKD